VNVLDGGTFYVDGKWVPASGGGAFGMSDLIQGIGKYLDAKLIGLALQ
jgi:hypothetical protein